jgi:hypothetical protein
MHRFEIVLFRKTASDAGADTGRRRVLGPVGSMVATIVSAILLIAFVIAALILGYLVAGLLLAALFFAFLLALVRRAFGPLRR